MIMSWGFFFGVIVEESEQDIQKRCLKYLRDKGFLAWKQPSQGLRVNGGKRAKARGGSTVGHPDIMALKDGTFYCIEVKKPKGKIEKYCPGES